MQIKTFTVSVAASTLALVGVVATPAHAVGVDLRTPNSAGGGYGTVSGDLTWSSRTRGVLTSVVTDHCPGDGLGTYVMSRATFLDGTTGTGVIAIDNDGCGDAENMTGHGIYNPNVKVIESVLIRVCLSNGAPAGWTDCATSDTSVRRYNPYV